ncbi:type II toxin-antitoxin system HipA family toxin [Promicromonospora soli]
MTDRSLAVHLYGQRIGTLVQTTGGGHFFTYTEAYVEGGGTPLSLAMPVAPSRYAKKWIDPFLEGLLPDNSEVRERWGQRFGVNGRNAFALLEHMGADCAGAVEFHPDETGVDRQAVLERVSEHDIAEHLAGLRSDDTAWAVGGERWSLAGAQGKFTLAQGVDGGWYEATGAAPSTHIVKPGVSGYRDQALNEHVSLRAARILGMNAAATEFVTFEGQAALVVTRYDRRRGADGTITRVHQEDMCQALSVYPWRKYEASGGPTAARIAGLLWESGSEPSRDVPAFVRAVAFNYLMGAPDAHAKNYSLLLAGSQVRLAPLYDVASAFPYDPTKADHELDLAAMGVGGEKRFGQVTGTHWDKLARQCRLPADQVREIVTTLATGIPGALEQAFEKHRTSALRDRMLTRIGEHCAATLGKL